MFFILENLRGERIFVVRSVGVNIKGSASKEEFDQGFYGGDYKLDIKNYERIQKHGY